MQNHAVEDGLDYCRKGRDLAKESGDAFEQHLALVLLGHAEYKKSFEMKDSKAADCVQMRHTHLDSARQSYEKVLEDRTYQEQVREDHNYQDEEYYLRLHIHWIQLEYSNENEHKAKELAANLRQRDKEMLDRHPTLTNYLKTVENAGIGKEPEWLPCWGY